MREVIAKVSKFEGEVTNKRGVSVLKYMRIGDIMDSYFRDEIENMRVVLFKREADTKVVIVDLDKIASQNRWWNRNKGESRKTCPTIAMVIPHYYIDEVRVKPTKENPKNTLLDSKLAYVCETLAMGCEKKLCLNSLLSIIKNSSLFNIDYDAEWL